MLLDSGLMKNSTPSVPPSLPEDKSTGASGRPPYCKGCATHRQLVKTAIANGMRIIRVRFGIPNSELCDPLPSDLGRFLNFLLAKGKTRALCTFPRVQHSLGKDGLWNLQRMGRKERWEFAHSVNSLKRNLPEPERARGHNPDLHRSSKSSARADWESRALSPPSQSPSPEFLKFIRGKLRKLFPYGWDHSYQDNCYRFVPNASSRGVLERADLVWSSIGRTEFLRRTLAGRCRFTLEERRTLKDQYRSDDRYFSSLTARFKQVPTAGKVRALTIFDSRIDLLGPLHKTIYHHLVRKGVAIKGTPSAKELSLLMQDQALFTSVDLVAATDNLLIATSEVILGVLLAKSKRVPGNIKLLAHASLNPVVGGRPVLHGQMMGGYLSFPLLCLHSWLAAQWACRDDDSKVIVNGDDCLIGHRQPLSKSSYPVGYLLNEGKTIFNSRGTAEINSTLYLRRHDRWQKVRHLRRGSFLPDYAGLRHASTACSNAGPKWEAAWIRCRFGKRWGFMPSQLGLSLESYNVYYRQRTMESVRFHTDLPVPDCENDPKLSPVNRAVTSLEAAMVVDHLWQNGRWGGMKRDPYNPSIGEVRRLYSYRKLPCRSHLTHGYYRGLCRVERRKKRVTGFVVRTSEDVTESDDDVIYPIISDVAFEEDRRPPFGEEIRLTSQPDGWETTQMARYLLSLMRYRIRANLGWARGFGSDRIDDHSV
nr:MAG: putative RNA-dependent RNA polymerase [Botourmiaviridae sp.]